MSHEYSGLRFIRALGRTPERVIYCPMHLLLFGVNWVVKLVVVVAPRPPSDEAQDEDSWEGSGGGDSRPKFPPREEEGIIAFSQSNCCIYC